MGKSEESLVRRYYEEMNNGRKNDLAEELFTADHLMHDPQVPTTRGPAGMVARVSAYQQAVDGHWGIEELVSAGDRVVVRYTGTGTHVGEIMGVPPTGNAIRIDAIGIHRIADGKIAESWLIWDALSFLRQLGAISADHS